MSSYHNHASLAERYEHLVNVMSSRRFLDMQGLGNEVPFFICPFKPVDTVAINSLQQQLINKLEQLDVRVFEVNLYDLSVDLIRERGLFERIEELEPTLSKDQLKELLQNILDPEQHLVPEIAKRIELAEYDVLFVTGVGEVFPYIRSHNVLNNLQKEAKSKPTVMFFSGEYTYSLESGAALVLFGRLQDDKYYRAFNINDYQV